MTILLIIFIVLAIASVPLTRFAVGSDYNLDNAAWYLKVILYPLSFALWGYLLFPLWAASEWAEFFQSKSPPFDLNLKLKGIVIASCWMIVVCQLFYRLGFRAGKKEV
jgi:hypothetical protein